MMTCSITDCGKRVASRGWCEMHYTRWLRHGDPSFTMKPGRRVTADGYVAILKPDHPLAAINGYVLEHRMVAWDAGLFTDTTWIVHHKNRDPADNRLENLEPMSRSQHNLEHDRGARNRNKTHCSNGHPFSDENTRVYDGHRQCVICARARAREQHRQRVEARLAAACRTCDQHHAYRESAVA